ncbi:MAG: cytochrome C oxidase subunit IV family protein [Planctomycetota bacterium]
MSDSHASHDLQAAPGAHEHGVGHVVPVKMLVGVLAALLVLTVVTVGVSYIDLGRMNVVVAMAVATVKAALVALFFMHLYWDKPFNGFLLVGSLFLVAVFLSFCMLDAREYRDTRQIIAPAALDAINALQPPK